MGRLTAKKRRFFNATEDGCGVYTALGFRPATTAMTLTLECEGGG